jgi:hypothetical protein
MTPRTWKRYEQEIAAFFGSTRTPLSGGNSKHTRSDTLHERIYAEVKGRKKHSAVTLWDKTKAEAVKEGKIPVVALVEEGRHGFWLMIHSSDLVDVARERETAEAWEESK